MVSNGEVDHEEAESVQLVAYSRKPVWVLGVSLLRDTNLRGVVVDLVGANCPQYKVVLANTGLLAAYQKPK